jgi:5-methylcytosine-specific restriction endonuclease McrA
MANWTKDQIKKQLPQFRNWLAANGAELLEPTNAWEVARFKASGETGVIYTNKSGKATFTGPAKDAWDAFKGAQSWRAAPATKRKPKSSVTLQAIRARDGGHCFYCLKPVDVEDESEEHLVSITHGGPQHISNKFLAHRVCNAKAGHMSAPEKIQLHVEAHLRAVQREAAQISATPWD